VLTLVKAPQIEARLDPTELVAVSMAFARTVDGWRHQVRFDPDERFATLLHADNSVDVWLCTWLPGQRTGLHDHAGSAASVVVVDGRLDERRVTRLRRVTRRRLRSGRPTWLRPGTVHDVENRTRHAAVSVHAYSPPLAQMSFYEHGPFAPLTRTVELASAPAWEAVR
jgi:predicted metal-dependent enzyme (double-stranded beta helix superfamily)